MQAEGQRLLILVRTILLNNFVLEVHDKIADDLRHNKIYSQLEDARMNYKYISSLKKLFVNHFKVQKSHRNRNENESRGVNTANIYMFSPSLSKNSSKN